MNEFTEWLSDILHATAFEMTPPTAYGAFHLTFAIVGFAVSLLLAWKLRNIGGKRCRILIFSVGAFLIACELYKQLFYYFCIGEVGYKWWIFPFHLCSVPMYLCVIAPIIKQGAISKAMYSFMMIYNLMGGFITFFEPSGINLSYWGLTLHAYTWHMTLVFVGLFLAFSGLGGKTIRDYWWASGTFVVLCVMAFCINLIFWDVSGGDINMFFVGPKNSSLVVFKDIAKNFGWYVSTLLYVPAVCLGAYIVFLPFHIWEKKKAPKTAPEKIAVTNS